MNRKPALTCLAAALVLSQGVANACGEGQFNLGQGLRYQGYLAPRPATVLVLDDGTADRRALYAGLQKAGHRLTLVGSRDAAAHALAGKRFDVVITDVADVDAVAASAAGAAARPRLLPVVARSLRNQPELRSRFELFLLDGASLGQYLKVINQALSARP
jgi:CheY-like chemotaxis protein